MSQQLRTRTVNVGLLAATIEEKRDTFQSKIDEAVDYLSRERVLASLFANFVFMERLRDGSALPEPDRAFFKSCLSSCIKSKGGGSLNADFDRFSELTGVPRLVPPNKLNFDQQREHEANCMATPTSTRATHHTEKRRISITRWLLRVRISRGDLVYKKYSTKLYNLAKKIITESDGAPEHTQKLEEIARAMDPDADIESIIEFAWKEKEFSDSVREDGKCASTITHLNWTFSTYVVDSRRMYEEVVSRAHSFAPGENKECRKKRYEFVKIELGEEFTYAPKRHCRATHLLHGFCVHPHRHEDAQVLGASAFQRCLVVQGCSPTFLERGQYQVSQEQGKRQVRVERAGFSLESARKWSGQVSLDDRRKLPDGRCSDQVASCDAGTYQETLSWVKSAERGGLQQAASGRCSARTSVERGKRCVQHRKRSGFSSKHQGRPVGDVRRPGPG